MRALAAVVALVFTGLHALEPPSPARDRLSRALFTALGVAEGSPANRLLDCSHSLGPTKCFSALSVWRAERAIEILESGREAQFNLREDVEQFPWQKYGNISEEQLYSQLSEDTEKLLRYRSLSLTIPGYSFELESKGNGTLNVDVLKNDEQSGRSMSKKIMKEFYNVMPMLLLPGLVMSAILPFILPALKMTTVAVGMLNNMALSGAVFTLLRNNAFNDHYEKKVIYVNEGYKNEKFSPVYFSKDFPKDFHKLNLDHFDEYSGSASNVQPVVKPLEQPLGQGDFQEENFNAMQEALNTDWLNQYYGNAGFSDSGSVGNAVSPSSLGNFGNVNNVVSPSSLNSMSNFVDISNVGGSSNHGSISSFGGVNNVGGSNNLGSISSFGGVSNAGSPSSISADSSNNVITVTGAPQAETKVRRSSKIKYNSYRG